MYLSIPIIIDFLGGAYLKCDIIMEACLNIFNDIRLRKAIGDAYYSVLYKHVLNIDHYIGYITPSTWESKSAKLLLNILNR